MANAAQKILELVTNISPDVRLDFDSENAHEVANTFLQGPSTSWGLKKIGGDSRTSTGQGTTVYLIDSGIRYDHKEFEGRASPVGDFSDLPAQMCDERDYACAADDRGHGTLCSAIAVGRTYGVAPGATIKALKYRTLASVYAAMDWITANGKPPGVISLSIGAAGRGAAWEAGVNAAIKAGFVVVAAAGSSNTDACGFTPGFVPGVITVGATTSSDAC